MAEYPINKGIGRPVEFKGLKAQYLFIFCGGLLALFVLPLVELDGGIFVDGARQVDRRAVYRSRQRVSS